MSQVQPQRAARLETRSRIVEAAARLLHEEGPAAVTTRAVADAAGVQAPAIYRLFGDKDGLLDAVAEHELARYVNDKTRAAETEDPVADLRAAWNRHIRFGLANPALFATLADPARAGRSPVAAAGLDVLRARVRRIAAIGRLRVAERRAVDLIHAAGTGAVLTLLAQPAEDRDSRLADLLYDAVMRTVLTEAPGTGTDHVSAAAVALRAAASGLPMFTTAERSLLAEWLDRLTESAKP
ncbi:TetR/AcrR family transcriptional regulator [Amycolatopsis sp. K13G38]|uniref:TetR/AcrR family transcriptional regulator n=1 Tax=Amycolatopsis acididurans TaxID=2724524 RepID=A0ABX1IZG7_9PSEU|nr:TetR/AcrR family transcriptional regulator [Amycolatopsis acididurans]NKQ51436.1 TetR/AcrR family transcriptional regulator [Amycolatopsis acididurans]